MLFFSVGVSISRGMRQVYSEGRWRRTAVHVMGGEFDGRKGMAKRAEMLETHGR